MNSLGHTNYTGFDIRMWKFWGSIYIEQGRIKILFFTDLRRLVK